MRKPFRRTSDSSVEFVPHKGQRKALNSTARFILLLAGTQSGKTLTGPIWLWNEIKRKGSGDYIIAAPTYPLMHKKLLPEFLNIFADIGTYRAADRIFKIKAPKTNNSDEMIKANVFLVMPVIPIH